MNRSIEEANDISIDHYLDFTDSGIKYNVKNINKFRSSFASIIQKNFSMIEHGDFSNYPLYIQYNKNKYKHIKSGYLCEININTLANNSLFANVGPNIPIKLSFMGDIIVDIDVDIKEYGINNAIVQLYAIVKVSNQVSMPLSSKNHIIEIKEPLAVDIIKGAVPNYYSNFS